MRRELDKLTIEDIKGIKRWLDHPHKVDMCPFEKVRDDGTHFYDCKVCEYIFPKFESKRSLINNAYYECPCSQFGISYVTRVARDVIKRITIKKLREHLNRVKYVRK